MPAVAKRVVVRLRLDGSDRMSHVQDVAGRWAPLSASRPLLVRLVDRLTSALNRRG